MSKPFTITRKPRGLVLEAPEGISISEFAQICRLAEALGFDIVDPGLAHALEVYSVFTTVKEAKDWRDEVEANILRSYNGRDCLEAWMEGTDTGASSMAMARVLSGESDLPPIFTTSDLGRCVRLLDRFPELKENLHLMRPISIRWGRIHDSWEELEALYRKELPTGKFTKLSAVMRSLGL